MGDKIIREICEIRVEIYKTNHTNILLAHGLTRIGTDFFEHESHELHEYFISTRINTDRHGFFLNTNRTNNTNILLAHGLTRIGTNFCCELRYNCRDGK